MRDARSFPDLHEVLSATVISCDAFRHAATVVKSPIHAALCLELARDHDRVAHSLMAGPVTDARVAVLEAVLESRRAYRLAMSLAKELLAPAPIGGTDNGKQG